jgi:hypothetical protein
MITLVIMNGEEENGMQQCIAYSHGIGCHVIVANELFAITRGGSIDEWRGRLLHVK